MLRRPARFRWPVLAVRLPLILAFRPWYSVDDGGVGACFRLRSFDVGVIDFLALPRGTAVAAHRPSRLEILALRRGLRTLES